MPARRFYHTSTFVVCGYVLGIGFHVSTRKTAYASCTRQYHLTYGACTGNTCQYIDQSPGSVLWNPRGTDIFWSGLFLSFADAFFLKDHRV